LILYRRDSEDRFLKLSPLQHWILQGHSIFLFAYIFYKPYTILIILPTDQDYFLYVGILSFWILWWIGWFLPLIF
jgi:hypothetical protein